MMYRCSIYRCLVYYMYVYQVLDPALRGARISVALQLRELVDCGPADCAIEAHTKIQYRLMRSIEEKTNSIRLLSDVRGYLCACADGPNHL